MVGVVHLVIKADTADLAVEAEAMVLLEEPEETRVLTEELE